MLRHSVALVRPLTNNTREPSLQSEKQENDAKKGTFLWYRTVIQNKLPLRIEYQWGSGLVK